jgi:hypothetical protein
VLATGSWLASRLIQRCQSKADTRTWSLFYVAAVVIFAMHGLSTFKLLAIVLANFALATHFRSSKLGPLSVWVFNLVALFTTDLFDGYRYAALHPALSSLVSSIRILDPFY